MQYANFSIVVFYIYIQVDVSDTCFNLELK